MAKVSNVTDLSTQSPQFGDVKKWFDDNMSLDKIDLDDQRVYEYVYHEGRFADIFQCTSKGAQRFFLKAKPRSVIDIAALTSIYRPGPLAADVDKLWLKHEKEPFDWGHPLINETLKKTRGLLVFQESVMELANKVGGFPMEQCDEIRRAIMKRSISGGEAAKKKAKELEDDFVKGAVNNGVSEDIAKRAYQIILFMSGYGFNMCVTCETKVCTYQIVNNKLQKYVQNIKNVKSGDQVMTRNEKTGQNMLTTVKKLHMNGKKKVVRLKLISGEEVICTLDHKFRTQETGEMLPLWMIQQKKLSIVVESVIKFSKNKNGLLNTK